MGQIVDSVRRAGVVGAGGAGFPAYRKIAATVSNVIVNGAECEPLLHKDMAIMENFPEEVIRGLSLVMDQCEATDGYVAIKKKNQVAIQSMEGHLRHRQSMFLMKDIYPAGDEFVLVYEITGNQIPPGGLPLHVKTVVNNVESLLNIARAADGLPVTDSFVTVAGAVARPSTFLLPVGTSFGDAIQLAGGATVDDFAMIDGGPMMGRVTFDLKRPITKTSSGLVVLPTSHSLIRKLTQPVDVFTRIGRSVCDQCSDCTELCPRYLLGYPIQPHQAMRTLGFSQDRTNAFTKWALQCCECNLCSLYACPEDLHPQALCVLNKSVAREQNLSWNPEDLAAHTRSPHPIREYREVPTGKLVQRLGLRDYERAAPLTDHGFEPASVKILTRQHIGKPAEPVVTVGQPARKGDVVGDVSLEHLGVPIHASIDGRIIEVTSEFITIEKQ